MNDLVRTLFRELADRPRSEREKLFAERQIAPELRAEVESLLGFDSENASSLTNCVSDTAQEMLRSGDARELSYCGPYRLVRLLGSGGMGAVYLAERSDGEIQQKVAVKVLHAGASRPSWRDRFLRERQLLANLNHPCIARVIDAGHTAESQPYLVMEYVDGVAIDTYAAALDLRDKLTLFLRVCDGVAHAHRQLIIHRDLKPSNILVDTAGQPKLLDFGIAKMLDETGDATQTVERMLTPNYASPEQISGALQTTATDVYSLGAVLYKLLTGQSPHESEARSSGLIPDLPTDVGYILRKALRQEPEERYPSVEAFASDVRAFLEWRPVEARTGDAWYRARKFLRRYRVSVTAALLVIASLSAGLYVANRERALAQRRFVDVRQLANKLFDIDMQARQLPGSTATRQLIVDTSLEYLRRLAADVRGDPELALEVGNAYMRVARVQGVPIAPNLGQMDQAAKNLRIAQGFIDSVLASHPANRIAILRSAQIAHDRMILARLSGRRDEALAFARKSAEWLQKFHAGKSDKSEASALLNTYLNVADEPTGSSNSSTRLSALVAAGLRSPARLTTNPMSVTSFGACHRSFEAAAISTRLSRPLRNRCECWSPAPRCPGEGNRPWVLSWLSPTRARFSPRMTPSAWAGTKTRWRLWSAPFELTMILFTRMQTINSVETVWRMPESTWLMLCVTQTHAELWVSTTTRFGTWLKSRTTRAFGDLK